MKIRVRSESPEIYIVTGTELEELTRNLDYGPTDIIPAYMFCTDSFGVDGLSWTHIESVNESVAWLQHDRIERDTLIVLAALHYMSQNLGNVNAMFEKGDNLQIAGKVTSGITSDEIIQMIDELRAKLRG